MRCFSALTSHFVGDHGLEEAGETFHDVRATVRESQPSPKLGVKNDDVGELDGFLSGHTNDFEHSLHFDFAMSQTK